MERNYNTLGVLLPSRPNPGEGREWLLGAKDIDGGVERTPDRILSSDQVFSDLVGRGPGQSMH